MESKNFKTTISCDAQCAKSSYEDVAPHFINDKMTQKVSILDIELIDSSLTIKYDDLSIPSLESKLNSLSNFDIKMGNTFLIIKELSSNNDDLILRLPYDLSYANIKIKVGKGLLSLPNLKSEIMKFENENAKFEIDKINTELLIIENQVGMIKIAKIVSDEIDFSNQKGDISVGQILTKKAKVKTGLGSVVVKKSTAKLDYFESDGGDIFWDSRLISNNSKGMN